VLAGEHDLRVHSMVHVENDVLAIYLLQRNPCENLRYRIGIVEGAELSVVDARSFADEAVAEGNRVLAVARPPIPVLEVLDRLDLFEGFNALGQIHWVAPFREIMG